MYIALVVWLLIAGSGKEGPYVVDIRHVLSPLCRIKAKSEGLNRPSVP